MTLLPQWKTVLTKAWSIRFAFIAAFFSGLEVTVPMLGNIFGLPDRIFAAVSGLMAAAAVLARVIAQEDVPAKTEVPTPLPIDLPDQH